MRVLAPLAPARCAGWNAKRDYVANVRYSLAHYAHAKPRRVRALKKATRVAFFNMVSVCSVCGASVFGVAEPVPGEVMVAVQGGKPLARRLSASAASVRDKGYPMINYR